jgi:hypothetical protein
MTIILNTISSLPAGPNMTPAFAALSTAATALATASAAAATASTAQVLLMQALTTKILLSNRGVAIGVKSATSGQNIANTNAVLIRRNSLAGPTDQFPIPAVPTGV